MKVRDSQGNPVEISNAEGRMLWTASNARGTYQPPAGQLEAAERLIGLGLLEQYENFASLHVTNDGSHAAAEWYGGQFAVGDEVKSAHFDGIGTVEGIADDEVGTVSVRLPEGSGVLTNTGAGGFAPEDLRHA